MSLVIPNVMPVFPRSDTASLYERVESPTLARAISLFEVSVERPNLLISRTFSATPGTTSLILPGTESPVLARVFSLFST